MPPSAEDDSIFPREGGKVFGKLSMHLVEGCGGGSRPTGVGGGGERDSIAPGAPSGGALGPEGKSENPGGGGGGGGNLSNFQPSKGSSRILWWNSHLVNES